jgi:hypothetical protein
MLIIATPQHTFGQHMVQSRFNVFLDSTNVAA